jgi:hypothetical protein
MRRCPGHGTVVPGRLGLLGSQPLAASCPRSGMSGPDPTGSDPVALATTGSATTGSEATGWEAVGWAVRVRG